jgi:hypothetical protein
MDKINKAKDRKLKKSKPKRIRIEFDMSHLSVLISALEVFSRLQSGQIKMAMDEVYYDRNLSYNEGLHIENTVRCIAFPSNITKNYDGHGGFYDQYGNEYDELGNIIIESEEWKQKKHRPHLDHSNTSFGVGCKEMEKGTVSWEIKKAIQEYLHYQRNNGYRDMGVDGDGVLNISGIPNAKVIDPVTNEYWKPEKWFLIPKQYQEKVNKAILNKDYDSVWKFADKAFKGTNPLYCGKKRIDEKDTQYYVVLEKPMKL